MTDQLDSRATDGAAGGGPETGRRAARHAVVIGGGVAGLLTARSLAAHAERVTVVERDRLPQEAEPRAGVPQGRHIHVLLEAGQRAMDELLPGVTEELRAAGAPRVGVPGDMIQWQHGSWIWRTEPTHHFLCGSRPQLEHAVRRRVLADPRVDVLEGTETVGLAGDAARVRGVLVRERGTAGRETEPRLLAADLVVDASGRGSKAPEWLAAIGAEPPREETLDTGLAYATRVYRNERHFDDTDALGTYIVPNPGQTHTAVVLPMEDGRFLVTLAGLRGDEPPTDEKGFEAFTEAFPDPLVRDWVTKAQPDSPVYGFRNTANVRRRYDLPGRRPAGFLVTGDALCTFNPIYGQGMSVGALGAVALRDALGDRRRTPSTARVQRALFQVSRQAWAISAGADRKMPGATGNAARTSAMERPASWYLARVQARAGGHPVVGAAFRDVLNLVRPVSRLFAPEVARAVLLGPEPPVRVRPPLRRTIDDVAGMAGPGAW
ncbi:FAD-dependent monooxygenase [Streptomyces sp. MUM 203J]|uniref:FAD-dependent oxidoreductase n=1 Tax=Streptomyces sp. MUM 203J TaxID=2791990 RepID=UPI001F03ECD5|nr:FAD-dependent oxidoreductase [Streptomyces sp. MUM 203J]MCH0543294.1 FAD-dependent monooxygenase [Streptomyces sp. MUM 203J]